MALATNILISVLFPIVAWLGPVIDSKSKVDYAQMRACGFTHTLNVYHTLNDALTDLDSAEKNGIGVYVYTPRMFDDTRNAVTSLSQKGGLAGYLLADEPSQKDIAGLIQLANKIAKVDAKHPCHVNLHPYYDDAQLRQAGIDNYAQYIRAASDMPLPVISFDYYSVARNSLRSTWFQNMTLIRNESLRTGRPFWGFILSVPHSVYKHVDASTMRLQAYVNLAYGAQGLVYFTYMTPKPEGVNDYHDAPIGMNGKKTHNYGLVQAMNRELNQVTSLFAGATVNRINHISPSFLFAETLKPELTNIKAVKADSDEGILVSEFTKNGHKYAAFVNKDHRNTATMYITTKNTTPKRITKSMKSESVKGSYTLQAGDILILRLK